MLFRRARSSPTKKPHNCLTLVIGVVGFIALVVFVYVDPSRVAQMTGLHSVIRPRDIARTTEEYSQEMNFISELLTMVGSMKSFGGSTGSGTQSTWELQKSFQCTVEGGEVVAGLAGGEVVIDTNLGRLVAKNGMTYVSNKACDTEYLTSHNLQPPPKEVCECSWITEEIGEEELTSEIRDVVQPLYDDLKSSGEDMLGRPVECTKTPPPLAAFETPGRACTLDEFDEITSGMVGADTGGEI